MRMISSHLSRCFDYRHTCLRPPGAFCGSFRNPARFIRRSELPTTALTDCIPIFSRYAHSKETQTSPNTSSHAHTLAKVKTLYGFLSEECGIRHFRPEVPMDTQKREQPGGAPTNNAGRLPALHPGVHYRLNRPRLSRNALSRGHSAASFARAIAARSANLRFTSAIISAALAATRSA